MSFISISKNMPKNKHKQAKALMEKLKPVFHTMAKDMYKNDINPSGPFISYGLMHLHNATVKEEKKQLLQMIIQECSNLWKEEFPEDFENEQ